MTPEAIAALIMSFVAMLGFGFNLIKWRREEAPAEKKTNSESDENLSNAVQALAMAVKTLIEPLEKRVNDQSKEIKEQNEKIENLEAKVLQLEIEKSEMLKEGILKDNRIRELQEKIAAQELEIADLRSQIKQSTP
jgi:predicted RNase H-like nuclease (RuvC/YqgF family)